jgi:hypothetical protein
VHSNKEFSLEFWLTQVLAVTGYIVFDKFSEHSELQFPKYVFFQLLQKLRENLRKVTNID